MKKHTFITFLLLSACSQTNDGDQYQETNRDAFKLNMEIDQNIVKPVSETYIDITSKEVRDSVTNCLENLQKPYYFVNHTLSFEFEKSATSVFRFATNSIFGFLGFFDVAHDLGLSRRSTTYKDTLKNIGIPSGDYVVLPIFGSNSENYVIGEAISWFCNPLGYFIGIPYMIGKTVLSIVNDRAQNSDTIDNIINSPMDSYSIMKDIYFQKYGTKLKVSSTENDLSDSPMPDDY